MENITFRKLTKEDWEKYKAIRLSSLRDAPWAFAASFESESKQKDDHWMNRFNQPELFSFVAEVGGRFIATTTIKKHKNGAWTISGVYTLPEFQRKGISHKLIETAIIEAKEHGATKARLWVNTINETPIHLYKKLGFEIVETSPDEKMGDGIPCSLYLMEKVL